MRTLFTLPLVLLFTLHIGVSRADPKSEALISTFESICLKSNGSMDLVSKWSYEKKFQEVSGAEARKLYTGLPTGAAWYTQIESSIVIVAIRSITNTCAIFSSSVTPDVINKYIDTLPEKLSGQFPKSASVKEDVNQGPYGNRRGRVLALGSLDEPIKVLITSITNEREGGFYQATLQAGFSKPK